MRTQRKMLAVAGVMTIVALSGCGAGGGESSSKLAMSAEELSQVQATVESHLKRPTMLGIDEPVESVPSDKTIYFVYSQTPTAAVTADAGKEAVEALGWTFKPQAVRPTPEGFQQGFENALRDPETDGIISSSVPIAAISKYVEQAESRGIPVVMNGADAVSEDNLYVIGGPERYEYAGTLQADYILADTKGDAQVLLVLPEAFPTIDLLAEGFKDEWKSRCPECSEPLEYRAPLDSFGANFPQLLTAYLQAHREVEYLVFGFSDMMVGVPSTLEGAGLTGLKATTWAQVPLTNKMLGQGLLEAQVSVPLAEIPWLATDVLLRVFNGQSTDAGQAFLGAGAPVHWIITEDTMTAAGLDPAGYWPVIAEYDQEFKKLWGLTG